MVDFQKVIGLVDVPNFKSSIVNKYGNTDDIKKAIFEVYNDYKLNTKKVSNLFKEKNIEKTAKNLWLFVRKNIEYEEDPNGKQFVKSPSILVYDRKGDCKSIAIFIASIFHNLGLNHGFRFVGYNKNSNKVTHIYNYVLDENGNQIFVDGCIEQFNILQNNFRFKQDHNMAEIHKVNAPDVEDFIGKFKPYKGNIIAVKNTDNIGFDFGNFLTNFDPTLQGSFASQALPGLLQTLGIPAQASSKIFSTLGEFGKTPDNLQLSITTPDPRFSESYYLQNNPDVMQAVQQGRFQTGWHHFLLHGSSEGRLPNNPQLKIAPQSNPNSNEQQKNNNENNDKPKSDNTLLYLALGGAALYFMNSKK